MQSFEYTIQDALGIHARPAGILTKAAAKYTDTTLTLKRGDKEADLKKLFRIMGLAVKAGETVTVAAQGPEEEAAIKELKAFFEAEL